MKTNSIIAILLIVFILVACTPATPSIATEAANTQTLSVTNTFIPTVLPTITPSPRVPSTPVPTYTPATPAAAYKLRMWSANDADLLVAQIASNLSAIEDEPRYQSVYGYEYYMEQYKYLAFAEEEAIFRFPNAQQAEKWHWDLCYNLAFSYPYAESADAPELPCYAKLIENGLNSGATTIDDLSKWFENHEPRFPFTITPHATPQGFTSAYVITLENSAFLWLLEQSGKFHVTGLLSSMFFYRESWAMFQQLDLTGDNSPELALGFSRSYCCGSVSRFFVYDVSSGTPKLLSFKNLSGIVAHTTSDYESFITPLETTSEHAGFIFNGHYGYDPLTQPCNVREYDKYYWNGYQFELVQTWFGIDEPGQYDDKEFCQFVIDTSKEPGELEVAVRTIGDIRVGDPNVTRDQILYRLGEYQARLGNIEKANAYFRAAISLQPADKAASKWMHNAQIFMDNLRDKNSYYATCAKIVECNMRKAVQQLIVEIQPDSYVSVPQLLKDSGVPIKSNGYMNFDANENIEQWLVIKHPNRSDREFWIVVQGSEKIYGVFVANIPANQPQLKEFQGSNNYVLTTSDGEFLISLENLSFSNQVYVTTHSFVDRNDPLFDNDYLRQYLVEEPLDKLTSELFSGVDPVAVQKGIRQLMQTKTFDCKKSYVCDQVYYLLGLTNELIGNSQSAAEIYVQLWKDYPDSLYTTMARSKLAIP